MKATEEARTRLGHRWVEGGATAQDTWMRSVLAKRHLGGGPDTASDPPWRDDPEGFLALVERERVGPLLHRALASADLVPASIRNALVDSYRATALRNLVRLHYLGECLASLAGAGIEVVVLKGAALAEAVYGNIALRPMVDIDLLVRRDDVEQTCAVLGGLGFFPGREETQPGVLIENENELLLSRHRGLLRDDIDLHWSLIDSPFYQEQLAMRWFWESARHRDFGDARALTLGPEALLLHLCAHLALHHGGSGLLWWNDIAELLRLEGATLDWSEVIARAGEFRLLLPLRTVLEELDTGWGVAVPEAVLRRLATQEPTRREADLFARLSGGETAGMRLWTDLRSMSDWRKRARFAIANLLPSPAYMRSRYGVEHAALLPLYYVYRWLRGGRDVVAALLGRQPPTDEPEP